MPIRFYLHSKTYADGRRPIYLDARWGKGAAGAAGKESRLRTGTGQSCQPANWNDEKGRIRSAEKGYSKANNELAELETAVGKHIERAELEGHHLQPDALLALLKPAAKKSTAAPEQAASPTDAAAEQVTMCSLYADWQRVYQGRRAKKTLDGPKGLIDQLEKWRPGTRPDELQPDKQGRCQLWEEFCRFCLAEARNRKGEAGLLNNTISSYVKRLSKLLRFGRYETEWLEDEFSEDVQRHPLTYDEVELLYAHEVKEWREGGNKHTQRAGLRDLFVFICRTGPRFSSLTEIGPDALHWEHLDGVGSVPILEYYAYKSRRKKEKLRVPLDEVALEIWQRYEGNLPVPSLGKFNEEIKAICREAGLKRTVKELRGSGARRMEERVPLWQTVSAHIGRYTFITTQRKGGASLETIQDTVGHADINTTRKYTVLLEEERLNDTLKSFAKLRGRSAR